MSTAALALLAAIVALVVAGVVAAMVVRARRASERRLDSGLLAIGERMDDLARELVTTVERVREDALRARIVESLGQALDLDEVLARCAEAAASLPGVAGAIVGVEVDGVTLLGLRRAGSASAGAVERAAGRQPRARRRDLVPLPGGRGADGPLRSAIAVPIEAETGHLGFLTVFGREEEPPVAGASSRRSRRSPTTRARRSRPRGGAARSRRVPDGDGLTGLGTRQRSTRRSRSRWREPIATAASSPSACFDSTTSGGRTSGSARSPGTPSSSRSPAVLRETRPPGRPRVPQRRRRVRRDPARVGPDRRRGALRAAPGHARAARPARPPPAVSVSAGIAELKPDDDGVSLFERAERALQRAKEAGKGTAA